MMVYGTIMLPPWNTDWYSIPSVKLLGVIGSASTWPFRPSLTFLAHIFFTPFGVFFFSFPVVVQATTKLYIQEHRRERFKCDRRGEGPLKWQLVSLEGKVPVGRPIGQLKESHMFGVWWIVFTVCWTPIKLLHVVCVIGVKQSHKVKESPSYQSLCYWNSYISNAYLMDCLILQVWNLLKHDVTWWGQRSVMMHEGNVQMKSIIWFPQHTNFTNSTIDRCLD